MTEVADVTEIRGCCDGTDVAEVADVTEIRGLELLFFLVRSWTHTMALHRFFFSSQKLLSFSY